MTLEELITNIERLRLVLARRKRLALGLCGLCLLSGSCRCFLCLLTVCHLQVKRCVNAPPTRLPNLVPFALTKPIMFTARLDALPVSFRLA